MVPAWTLILLTAVFFIREVYQKSKQTPTDFDSGYKQAISDISGEFNKINELRLPDRKFLIKFRDYLQSKLNGGG